MIDFSENSLRNWFDKLPLDVKQIISPDGVISVPSEASLFLKSLSEEEIKKIPKLVSQNTPMAEAMGRVGRIRLMSWISANSPEESVHTVFRNLLNEDEEEGEVGGKGKVSILFLEDLKLLQDNVITPRLTNSMINDYALNNIMSSVYILENDVVMQKGSGGMV